MATLLKNKILADIGTTEQLILTTDELTRVTIIGLSLTNTTDSVVLTAVRVLDVVSNSSAYYIKNVIVPPNQSLRVINGGEKLILAPSMSIYVQSNIATSLDLIMSYVAVT